MTEPDDRLDLNAPTQEGLSAALQEVVCSLCDGPQRAVQKVWRAAKAGLFQIARQTDESLVRRDPAVAQRGIECGQIVAALLPGDAPPVRRALQIHERHASIFGTNENLLGICVRLCEAGRMKSCEGTLYSASKRLTASGSGWL